MFSNCRNSSKIGFTAFVSVFTVFLRGVRVIGGGVTIHIYIYIHIHIYMYMYMYIYVCI